MYTIMSNYRFCYQENQFWGDCLPCTPDVFNRIVDSPDVAAKISTRQAVEAAVAGEKPLEEWTSLPGFREFCQKKESDPKAQKSFATLTIPQKLIQWTYFLKTSLPCFIFAASGFDIQPVTDKAGAPVLDKYGRPVTRHLRKLNGIHLCGLFMFDGDDLPMPPAEVFNRTQAEDFHWRLRLAHVTSSGKGIRLVCEARPELGNIADNQICLARELGLMGVLGPKGKPVVDNSCIDASRISYAPRREDILFIDEENLFNI